MTHSPLLRSYLAIVLGALFIGVSGVLYKLSAVDPITGAFWRMVFALPISFIWMQKEVKSEGVNNWLFVILAGVAFALDIMFFHSSINYTFVGNATTISATAPILVIFFALFIGEKPSLSLLLAVFLAILGALFIMSAKDGFQFSSDMKGSFLALGSCLFFALYIVFARVARRNNKTGLYNFYSTAFTAITCLVCALIAGETILPQTWQAWGYLIALGIISHGFGQGLTAYGLGRVPSGIASVLMAVNAPISVVVGALVFSEIPLMQQVLGIVLIIFALILIKPK